MFDFNLEQVRIHHFASEDIQANMYVFMFNNDAVIVDPNFNDEALNLLKKSNIKNAVVFLTHEHPDHTCGLPYLKEIFDFTVICQSQASFSIANKVNNRPLLISFILAKNDEINGTNLADEYIKKYREFECSADTVFDNEYKYYWHNINFNFRSTPGHSLGSCCILVNDKCVITGDSLLPDYPVITRFPGGSIKDYREKTLPFLQSLNPNLIVLPGHGRLCKLGECLRRV